MFRRGKMISVALLIGPLLFFKDKTEGTKLFQKHYSIQTGKWALSKKVLWLSEGAEQDSNKVRERPKVYVAESFEQL